MAGHSKWANIKHKKARQDAARGKIFTKIARELMVAARQGGPDPEANFRLRLALQKARDANMPNDNIKRAISRGSGDSEGENYEQITYEGYGPGGIAILMDILTDNRNRTVGEIRHILSRNGGNLGESGCVAWMFNRKGLILVSRENSSLAEDELMLAALEAGAEDVRAAGEGWEVVSSPEEFETVKAELEGAGIAPAMAEITMLPDTLTKVEGELNSQLMQLIETLEEHDDVQNIYTNWDMPEDME
ncbi:MAG: YebC/PmpR family DNA-binding transcriptional regulator [Firmicutes bacterium]|nr:YebC/PmpR family DNA-binding transcriptional regulator [Bacillota bacterium]